MVIFTIIMAVGTFWCKSIDDDGGGGRIVEAEEEHEEEEQEDADGIRCSNRLIQSYKYI
jgi:hypothetical protein